VLFFCRGVLFVKRGCRTCAFMDFSVLPGRWGYFCWKLGIVEFWQKHFVQRFKIDRDARTARRMRSRLPAPRRLATE
jgi:hypothetical protein